MTKVKGCRVEKSARMLKCSVSRAFCFDFVTNIIAMFGDDGCDISDT
jgi:hypothetical protein